jgi:hypothetical protein
VDVDFIIVDLLNPNCRNGGKVKPAVRSGGFGKTYSVLERRRRVAARLNGIGHAGACAGFSAAFAFQMAMFKNINGATFRQGRREVNREEAALWWSGESKSERFSKTVRVRNGLFNWRFSIYYESMPFLAISAVVAGWFSHHYWERLGNGDTAWEKRFLPWLIQGLVFPWLIFCIFNLGWGSGLPPLVPQILDAQRSKGPWLGTWFIWCLVGAILVTFYWSAITYCWLLARIMEQAPNRRETLMNIAFFGLFSFTIAGLLTYFSGWIYIGPGLCMALLPIVHFTTDLAEKAPVRATYGKAIGRLKMGRVEEAELEVISQLEKSENDFEGWMMLAEMYAKEFRNIEDAARVVLDICKQGDAQPVQISIACHKLADWQLEISENPIGARAAMELLCRKLPGTHFAHMAQQRMRQIPRTIEEFDDGKKRNPIRLPTLSEQAPARRSETASRAEAVAEANRLSDKLTDDPNDIATREKLAFVLGEKLAKIDLAVEQLKLLMDLPETSEEQNAKWLAQIASWEFNRDQDVATFQVALRALIDRYPRTSHAIAAGRRLYLLEMDTVEQRTAAAPVPVLRIS